MRRREKPKKLFRVFVFDRDVETRKKLLKIFEKKHRSRISKTFYRVKTFLISSPKQFEQKFLECGDCFLVVDMDAVNLEEDLIIMRGFCREMTITTIRVRLDKVSQLSP
jgi:glycerol-3-phosphate cytidylyltransferase-like family protein